MIERIIQWSLDNRPLVLMAQTPAAIRAAVAMSTSGRLSSDH